MTAQGRETQERGEGLSQSPVVHLLALVVLAAEEHCIWSTHHGVRLEERGRPLSLLTERRRKTCVQRQVSPGAVWALRKTLCNKTQIHHLGAGWSCSLVGRCEGLK